MPLLDDLKSVLSFSAFRPDPDDPAISWSKRFTGRRSLLLNVSRTQTTWRAITKRGRFQEAGSKDGDFAQVAAAHAEEWRALTDGGWCSVSVNNRFIISLETSLSRRENFAELLRTNPKSLLGAKYDKGKRYALYQHPETSSSILMACDDSAVKAAEDVLRVNGLKAGRVCCGLFALLENRLSEIYASGRPEAKGSFMLVACCDGSIAALVQQAGQWTDLRCRCGVGTESAEAMLQIIAPLVQKLQADTPLLFVHDGNDAAFAGEMMRQLQQVGGQDVTAEDELWRTIGLN